LFHGQTTLYVRTESSETRNHLESGPTNEPDAFNTDKGGNSKLKMRSQDLLLSIPKNITTPTPIGGWKTSVVDHKNTENYIVDSQHATTMLC
jgi:hypothetical protein